MNKDVNLTIRMSGEDREKIKQAAKDAGMTTSDFVREAAKGKMEEKENERVSRN